MISTQKLNHDVLPPLTLPAGDAGAADRLALAGAAAVPQREAEHRVTWQVGELDWEVQPLHWFQAQREVKCLYAVVMGRWRAAPACCTTALTTRSGTLDWLCPAKQRFGLVITCS